MLSIESTFLRVGRCKAFCSKNNGSWCHSPLDGTLLLLVLFLLLVVPLLMFLLLLVLLLIFFLLLVLLLLVLLLLVLLLLALPLLEPLLLVLMARLLFCSRSYSFSAPKRRLPSSDQGH